MRLWEIDNIGIVNCEEEKHNMGIWIDIFPLCNVPDNTNERIKQKARREYLTAHPLCVKCMADGRYRKATVVDHIVPHRGDERLFWDRSNWQALCKRHHDLKTGNEDSRPLYHY